MTTKHADVIVLGAGSVGVMAAWRLAQQGHRVIGIDRGSVPGPFSGYAGESRLFRMVYAEGAHYMPLLLRSRELWRELEEASGRELLRITGGVTISKENNWRFQRLRRASESQGLEYSLLDATEARERFPLHAIDDDSVALFDPGAGYVRSEVAVLAASQLARVAGAEFLEHRRVLGAHRAGDKWVVRTDQETVAAPRVIVATGTGAGPFAASLGAKVSILPQVLSWFPIRDPDAYVQREQTIFLRNEEDARFYGFPSADGWTVKLAASVYLDEVETYDHPFEVHPEYLDAAISYVAKYMPGLEPRPVRAATCADGYTSDENALFGLVDGLDGVVSAVGLSGHGFKLATGFGDVAAKLAIEGVADCDVSFLDANRFATAAPSGLSIA